MRTGRLVAVGLLLVASAALAGCNAPPAPQGVVPTQDAQGRYVIHMTDRFAFEPAEARVPAGATVVWANDSNVEHDVHGYVGDDDMRFSSSLQPPYGDGRVLGPGAEYGQVLDEAGMWTIWCHTHHDQDMKGVIHVG